VAGPDLDTLSGLMDEAKCFALVRRHRWPDGVRCAACGSGAVIRDGRDEIQPQRQRYRCKGCAGRFDDLTGTVLAGHHQPLRVWVVCLIGANFRVVHRIVLRRTDIAAVGEVARLGDDAGWRRLAASRPRPRRHGWRRVARHAAPG
jgi:transposase-like protein